MATRGIRNNNPLNIRHSKSKWQGMRPRQTDRAFVQFATRRHGYRAAFVLLRGYIQKGKDTIGKIIARWAPSSDGNDTQAYIEYVSRTTGIPAGRPLRFEDRNDMVEIVRSMAHIESAIIEDKTLLEQAYEESRR